MLQQSYHPTARDEHQNLVFKEDVDNCLSILGLEILPNKEQLKKAYKTLVKQWHPDRFHGRTDLEKLAVKKTQYLNLSYRYLLETLKNTPTDSASKQKNEGGSNRHNYTWQKYSDGFPEATVDEFFLNSSHIVSAGYHAQRKILYLKFLGDEIYLYFDVPEFIFLHLLKASSSGRYALKFIYNRFRYRKFTPITKNFRLE